MLFINNLDLPLLNRFLWPIILRWSISLS